MEPKPESQAYYQTVLFTDIKGSTAFFEKYGDQEGLRMLKEHENLLFPIIRKYEGSIIKTIGDAILAVFDSGEKAVRASIEMQVALKMKPIAHGVAEVPLTVRMGLHAGMVHHREKDVFGDAVNLASRMETLADGGQIIVSQEVYELIRTTPGFVIKIQGEVMVKGHQEPVPVYRILWDPIREYVDVPPSIPDAVLKIKTPKDVRIVNIYNREKVLLGRQKARPGMPGSDIVVRNPEDDETTKRISRQHILISATSDGYTLTDLSARGTELGGVRVPPKQAVELPLIGQISLAKSADILFEQILDPASGFSSRPVLRLILPEHTMAVVTQDRLTIGSGRVAVKIEDKKGNNVCSMLSRGEDGKWRLTISEGNAASYDGQPLPVNAPLGLMDGSKWVLNDLFEFEFIHPPR